MIRYASYAAVAALVMAGCGENTAKRTSQTAEITSDSRTLEDATAAVNSVIQNAQDCEVVKAALPDATRRLDEAAAKLQTSTGKVTLDTLRTQMRAVAQNCS